MMKDEIVPLFPTPFFNCFIDVSSSDLATFKNTKMRSRHLGYISEDQQVLDKTPNTLQQIMTKTDSFVEMLGFNLNLRVTSSWVNLHEGGGMGRNHIHANSIISGVLFLDTPPNSGKFHVMNPANNGTRLFSTHIQPDKSSVNVYNTEYYAIEPVTGQCIMFPSYLSHMVGENMTEESRWTVAFNLFPTGILRENNVAPIAFE